MATTNSTVKLIEKINNFMQSKFRMQLVGGANSEIKSELEVVICDSVEPIHLSVSQKVTKSNAYKNEVKQLPNLSELKKTINQFIDPRDECHNKFIELLDCIEKNNDNWCNKANNNRSSKDKKYYDDLNYLRENLKDLNFTEEEDESRKGIFENNEGSGNSIIDPLGVYFGYKNKTKGVIVILNEKIKEVAKQTGISNEVLLEIVLVHEFAHAYHHLGIDEFNKINEQFHDMSTFVIEGVANYFVTEYINSIFYENKGKYNELNKAFQRGTSQKGPYVAYKLFLQNKINLKIYNNTDNYFRLNTNNYTSIDLELFTNKLQHTAKSLSI